MPRIVTPVRMKPGRQLERQGGAGRPRRRQLRHRRRELGRVGDDRHAPDDGHAVITARRRAEQEADHERRPAAQGHRGDRERRPAAVVGQGAGEDAADPAARDDDERGRRGRRRDPSCRRRRSDAARNTGTQVHIA